MATKQKQVYQLIIVVDTNIVFSALLNPEGTISDLILNSTDNFNFCSPSNILEELENHQEKIIKHSGIEESELIIQQRIFFKRIELIDLESISQSSWRQAVELTKDVDEFDTPFVALSLELKSSLWTGDKKLIKGLKNKGFEHVLSTEDLKRTRG